MRTILILFAFLFASAPLAIADAPSSACVLVSERPNHPIVRAAKREFSKRAEIRYFPNSVPKDLLGCIESGVTHIAWIAHSAELPWNPDEATLAYFGKGDSARAPKLVHPQILARALELLDERERAGNPLPLRRISFMSCQPDHVRRHYPELAELERRGIEIRFAPVNRALSRIHRKEVVSMNPAWIFHELELPPTFPASDPERDIYRF